MTYDGTQLSSLFGYLNHGIMGDSIIAWRGACDIATDKIVDAEDLIAGHKIYSEDMLHFIVEAFQVDLFSMACLQRLFADLTCQSIYQNTGVILRRKGDDLYKMQSESRDPVDPVKDQDFKLNISIATVSPTSALLHFGINISSKNTPVKTVGLNDLNIAPEAFAEQLMSLWSSEYQGLRRATQKVKWVK